MASSGRGFRPSDGIPEVGMKIVEPDRVGSKRVRDSLSGMVSHGFYGTEKKAAIYNHMYVNSDGTSKIGGHYLHSTQCDRMLTDFTARSSISSPGENLGNKIKGPDKICTLYNQGQCNKGNSCTFLHEIEGPGSDFLWKNEEKAGLLAADAYGSSRGSEEGSQFKYSDYRPLIHVYGETDRSMHSSDKQSTFTLGFSQGMSSRFDATLTKRLTTPMNELLPSPVVYEKKQELSMGHHSGLTSETHVNGRGTFPRLLDRGIFQSAADKRTYLDVNYSDSKLYRSFDQSGPSDAHRHNEKLSAYGGTEGNLPKTHHKEHLSSHATYNSYSLPDFRNPLNATSGHSFGNPTIHPTSHQGSLSLHLSSPVVKNVGAHNYVNVGTSTSRSALLASSSPHASILSPVSLSPIKYKVWVTSVPFVPSIDFPDIKTPPRTQYDPFVDYMDSPKDGNKNNLKSSRISRQHTKLYSPTPKSLYHDQKLARNMPSKGSNALACLIASDRGCNSSLDDNNRVKVDHRKPSSASYHEKTRNFRFRLADHVKELIAPDWKEGYLSKDAHKLVVKKSIDKVLSSIKPHHVPTSEEAITNYITISKSKIESLVKAYVDRHRTT